MVRLLELFSGTKSVSKAVGHKYSEVINVDMMDTYKPSVVTDILDWNYKVFPPGYFHTIWASPPCTEYSKLNQSNPQKIPNLELADSIVKKTIEIIEYFKPYKWYIENPQTGTLKDREFMWGIPFYDVDYCSYSDWGYKKRTRFWTNIDGFKGRLCRRKDCPNKDGKSHKIMIGNIKGRTTLAERYRIPQKLITDLFECEA
jgi:site-specific DNA-cytosine methylase